MKPEIALKFDYDILKKYTRQQIEAARDEWVAAYREIAEKDSSKRELCDYLVVRIIRVAELFIRRHIEPVVSDAISHDDSYYEWLDEMKKEENDSLDGDFPLGNEEDMAFASSYFTVKELAQIQTGCADDIFAGHYVEYADRVLVRKGVLAEVKGDFKEAAAAYSGISTSKMIQDRENACRRKMRELMLEHNERLNKAYKEFLEVLAKQDEQLQSIFSIQYKFYAAISDLLYWAFREEEKAFVRECELKMIPYYQRALEEEYRKFKAQKEIGILDYTVIDSWTLTVDQNGNPVKTTVVDVQKGKPVYADGCIGIEIADEARSVGNCRYELRQWLESNTNVYELKVAAEELKKKGALGMSPSPEPNYDLGGLSGGQLDAAAWQNYAIEHGMVRRTNYDEMLDKLLIAIDECIDFYEKAISIV
ncbi:MAG: hypothetical protein E7384_05570 [Ruminococcaceae bacterium]|nr:hypothetical protein [Oscillospiraceae bacterium]